MSNNANVKPELVKSIVARVQEYSALEQKIDGKAVHQLALNTLKNLDSAFLTLETALVNAEAAIEELGKAPAKQEKATRPADLVQIKDLKMVGALADANPDVVQGTKDGYVELYFDGRPDKSVLNFLKHKAQFRWHAVKKCWYGQAAKIAKSGAKQAQDKKAKTPVKSVDKRVDAATASLEALNRHMAVCENPGKCQLCKVLENAVIENVPMAV